MSSSPLSVMVVDDEEELAILFKRFLERFGYNTAHFTDPQMALDHFRKNYNKIHLVITDLRMPRLNGIELANKIREHSKTVKILLITAFVVDDLLRSKEVKEAGITEILQKPISFTEFGPKVSEILTG